MEYCKSHQKQANWLLEFFNNNAGKMNHKFLKPRQVLNKAFLKVKPLKQVYQLVFELYGLGEKEIKIVEGGEG